MAFHAPGLSFMALGLRGIQVHVENRDLSLRRALGVMIGTTSALRLLLAVLHGIEAAFWAVAFLWVNALGSPEAAIPYSVDSVSTRGASGLMLNQHWQMMGALEWFDGMLRFGISTAFIFAVMQVFWPILMTSR